MAETRSRLIRLSGEMSRTRLLFEILLRPLALAVAAGLLVRWGVVQTYSIPSASMYPTMEPGDHIAVTPSRGILRGQLERGEVVVFRSPSNEREFFVKRIIAGPDDELEVRTGIVFVNGRALREPYLAAPGAYEIARGPIRLGKDEFFVMGDNRADSVDSRAFGPLRREQIVGEARLIFWSAGAGNSETYASAMSVSTPGQRSRAVRWERILSPVR